MGRDRMRKKREKAFLNRGKRFLKKGNKISPGQSLNASREVVQNVEGVKK